MSYEFCPYSRNKSKREPPYIVQGNCGTCVIITYLNAYIHKYGKSPLGFEYGTKKYIDLILKKCKGVFTDNLILYPQDKKYLLKFLHVELIKHRCKTPKELKAWFIKMLQNGYTIDATALIHGDLHSFLIADYDKRCDSFKCINGRFFTWMSAIEWLPLHFIYGKSMKTGVSRFEDEFIMTKRNVYWNIMKDATAIKL